MMMMTTGASREKTFPIALRLGSGFAKVPKYALVSTQGKYVA